jgi:hypothetical protein
VVKGEESKVERHRKIYVEAAQRGKRPEAERAYNDAVRLII